jgi:Leucine-rich repeat (LRR) protein
MLRINNWQTTPIDYYLDNRQVSEDLEIKSSEVAPNAVDYIRSELNKREVGAIYFKLSGANLLGLTSTDLSSLILSCRHLKYIDFSVNRFDSIPPEIGLLTNLERIDLSTNQIKHLPSEMARLKNLNYISLSFNLLEEFPKEILELASLTSLNLLGNPLRHHVPPSSLKKLAYFNDKRIN